LRTASLRQPRLITDEGRNAVTTGNNALMPVSTLIEQWHRRDGLATAAGRVFNFVYAPGGTPGEEALTGTNHRMGIVTNLFFWSNRYRQTLSIRLHGTGAQFSERSLRRGVPAADFVRARPDLRARTMPISTLPTAACRACRCISSQGPRQIAHAT
jgi:hypothetical protein